MRIRFILVTILIAGFFSFSSAQSIDRFGGNKDACGRNYTIYYEMYKLKNYAGAIPFWQKTIDICPRFSISLWKNGEKMYQHKIKNSPDSPEKEMLIDSLMWIYDQRMLYFGDDQRAGTGYVLGRKGLALLNFRKSDAEKAYDLLSESIKIEGNNSKSDVVLTYMQASRFLYKDGILSAENVLSDFETCTEIIKENLSKDPGNNNFLRASEGIEKHFINSGAANCEALVSVFSKQFESNRSDAEWMAKISRQLKTAGCSDNAFFQELALAQFELNPSGDDAHKLAQTHLKKGDFEEALPFLIPCIRLGVEDNEKAQVYYELAYIQFSHFKAYEEARNYARKAIEIRPNWGDPYLLIGRVYIDARKTAFTGEFDQTTVLWVAIDEFAKAKKADPEVREQADALIKSYSKLFPRTEALFFYTLKKGDPYQVKGWINAQTTVRASD